MAAPPNTRLQSMLQTAVQSVQWTYILFWQLCPQQGILVWRDGYYNGAIKTRKTVQPMEVSAEEASLQRSQQLRELYDSLSVGESNQQTRRPCAALSPEDLTESEWFYLMCVSFSFPPGVGLPGKAYAKRQHVWLTGANEVDSKVFSRAILAKSARVRTVVCIPLLDGVVELGNTEKVQEDIGFIHQVKSFFIDHHPPPPPKPALSEHSTSNPATSSSHPRFHSNPLPPTYAPLDPALFASQIHLAEEEEDNDDDEEEVQAELDSEAHTGPNSGAQNPRADHVARVAAEPSELMQLEMSEDIQLGSPDDGSNHLDPDFQLMVASQGGVGNPVDHPHQVDSFRAESARRWPLLQDPLGGSLQAPTSGGPGLDELTQEDTHYSQTVATILQHQSNRWSESSPSLAAGCLMYSSQSSFSKLPLRSSDHHLHHHHDADATSQCLLKYILFTVPFLHSKYQDDNNSPKSATAADSVSRFRKPTPQDEPSANHVLAERRRREKLNERFIILRSLVPFVTKMDKASILGDTIEYVKQLRKKIQDLEARARQIEIDQLSRSSGDPQRSGVTAVTDKRKLRIVEGSSGAKGKAVDSVAAASTPPLPAPPQPVAGVAVQVQVSIIESEALVELQCTHREGLLLDVMVLLLEHRVEVTAVQSSLTNGVFVAELRAKVKENVNGKKPSIVEVKRAIHQIIPQY
ncbi:transcription factor BHLH42-like [Actinidia eriantha]|uniref:transcription factor BHLH42-like n=1 Tax=Actinidia eriantha TaxID=165200 RepID=UPI00258AB8CA|nr:transcription factor BHLH42-like [Actinidia eriantha]